MTKKRLNNRRGQLLGGVGMAILASSPAMAGTATVTQNISNTQGDVAGVADAFETIYSNPINSGPVSASVLNATAGISRIDSWNGTTLSSTNTLSTNVVSAEALGNTFANSASLSVLDSEEGSDGITSLGLAVNTGSVQSLVGNTQLLVSLVNTPLDSAANSGNTVKSASTINAGTTSLTGAVPSTYSSGAAGHATFDALADAESTGGVLDSSGSLLAATVQYAVGTTPSTATTRQTDIGLDLSADDGAIGSGVMTTSGASALSDNTVSSNYAGNAATTTVSLTGGANPTFTGSAVSQTAQINTGNFGGDQALTTDTAIHGSVDSASGDINSLTGSLTVAGNTVTSAATGNQSLANALTLDGIDLSGASSGAGSTVDDRFFSANQTADGALVFSAMQYNDGYDQVEGAVLSASTLNTAVSGSVQQLSGGSLSVTGNSVGAAVRGNNLADTLGTNGTVNTLSGGVTASAYQLNDGTALSATLSQSGIAATAGSIDGTVTNGSIALSDNTASATGYGNQASHLVSLDATSLNAGSLSGANLSADLEGLTTASGLVTLNNVQANYGSPVSVANIDSTIRLASDAESSTSGSSLAATGNRQEAVAAGNIANSTVHVGATTLGGGAGLVSAQTVAESSSVTSSLVASASATSVDDIGSGSTLSLSDNLQRAVAYGSSASNALDAAATQTSVGFNPLFASSLSASDFEGTNQVGSTFGLLNNQVTLANVGATATPVEGDASFAVRIGNNVETSTVANNANTLVAAAYGTSATNAAKVALGTVDDGIFLGNSSLANVANAQYVDLGATVSALAAPGTSASVLTDVAGEVRESSVATNGNTVQAQALGNKAANSLAASGTTVFVPGISAFAVAQAGAFEFSALGVNNLQVAGEGITFQATLRDSFGDPANSAGVLTHVDSDVVASSVVSLGNSLLASAGANTASNLLSADINTLAGSAAVNNLQDDLGNVSATIGVEGSPGTPAINSNYVGSGTSQAGNTAGYASSYNFGTQTLNVTDGETVTLQQGSMSATEWNALVTYMTARGWASSGTALSTTGDGSYDVSFFNSFGYTSGNGIGAGQASYAGFSVGGTPAVPNQGGVTIALGSDITASTVKVADNLSAARGVGNEAVNTLAASGNAIGQVIGSPIATTGSGVTSADFVVNNGQQAQGNVATENFGTFAIAQDAEASIDSSALGVTGNTQSAKSIGNLAGNTLTLAATDLASLPASGALGSVQSANQATTATSTALFSVPAESQDSTIAISGNSNVALAVQNEASNTVGVNATNAGSVIGNVANASSGLVQADVVLGTSQQASGLASAVAGSTISNQDSVDLATSGVLNGSVAFTGNLTSAEAAANRADNAAGVGGSAAQTASVGLSNTQQSSSVVSASATSTTQLALTGFSDAEAVLDLAPFQASSGSVSGNTTQALARGNTATNTLVSAAGAVYGGGTSVVPAASGGVANANAVVLNSQGNTGGISAQATNAVYSVVLNSGAGAPGVQSSNVAVGSNTASAAAYGNQATNSLTLNSLNTGLTTGAVYSNQTNSGPVSAIATSVSFGINAGAGVTNASTFGVSGNAVTATAVGNSAVSSILAH